MTDNLEGKLVVETEITKTDNTPADSILFANVYTQPTPEPPPQPESPKTGDATNIFMWFALLFVSSTGLTVTTVYSKKSKSKDE